MKPRNPNKSRHQTVAGKRPPKSRAQNKVGDTVEFRAACNELLRMKRSARF